MTTVSAASSTSIGVGSAAAQMSAEAVRGLLESRFDARFRLMGADEKIRMCAAGDPCFTLHATVESAWNMWD